ncbi:hypothetical protein [Microbacterium sp. LMI1-1-1.1]|uniref:hypothetical protein n=1 Tax=Microbacterium sp. LMI1-1-1.1 TaxID=3135223 RepID=UPI0034679FD8
MSAPHAPGPSDGVSFAAPHVPPPTGTLVGPPETRRRRRPLGRIALVLAIVAGVLAPAVAGLASFRVARGAGGEFLARGGTSVDWRVLSPVRDLVLVAEASFWAATVLGVAALVVGIVATARGLGRGAGITAIVLSVLGPLVFSVCVALALFAGAATVSAGGGSPI